MADPLAPSPTAPHPPHPHLRPHPSFPSHLQNIGRSLYTPHPSLSYTQLRPQPTLTPAVLCATLYLSRLRIGELPTYRPPPDPYLIGPARYVTKALRDILGQLEHHAKMPVGRYGIFVKTEMPGHLEPWHMHLVWFVMAFLEEGCGIRGTVTVDHKEGVLMVQLPRRVEGWRGLGRV